MGNASLTQAEITGAVTDLALGIIIIPLILILRTVKTDKPLQKKWWMYFLISLDVTCLLGFLAHYCFTAPIPNRIVWIPLFTVMYEIFNCFFLACVACSTDGRRPTKRDVSIVHFISLAGYTATHITVGIFSADSIMVMTCFNSVLAIVGFALLIKKAVKKGNTGEKLILLSLVPLMPAAYFQIKRSGFMHFIWDFDQNGISHLLITAGTLVLFFAILVLLKPKNSKEA